MSWKKNPLPPSPPQPTMRAIGVIVCAVNGENIAGAAVAIQDTSTSWQRGVTDDGGYLLFPAVPMSLQDTQLQVEAEGFVPFDEHIILLPNIDQQVWLGGTPSQGSALLLPAMQPSHYDPSVLTLGQLSAIRGSMWTNRVAIPYGPRPGQPDNINAMDYYEWYAPEDRASMVANYRAKGYTHAVTGPMIDPDGYHGQYPTYPGPLTQSWWDHYLDCMQEWWDAGIAPMHFALPEPWSVAQGMVGLEPFFRQARAQQLLRIIVLAWEPSTWSNAQYVDAAKWLSSLFPNALICLHTEPDHNAPGLSSELSDALNEAQMWANVAPYIHLFLQQTKTCYEGTAQDQGEWLQMWDRYFQGSWDSRFLDGYHGWPTFSKWGTHGILAGPAEYASYWAYWENAPESGSISWGDKAMANGARFFLDGGSV